MKKIELFRGRKSPGVRKRILFSLVSFVGFVIALLWLFQIVLLDDFYHLYKSRQLVRCAELLTRNIDNDNLSLLADRVSTENDLCVLLLNGQGAPVVSAEGNRFCLVHHMSPRDLAWWQENTPADGTPSIHDFSTQTYRDTRYRPDDFKGAPPRRTTPESISMLYAIKVQLPGGDTGTLLLNTLVTPVDATVSTLRFQLLTITGIVLLAALALAFIVSRTISRPLIETNEAARDLARGAYTPAVHSASYREISELNATLTAAAEELGKVEQLQHELIANISHDLRTPLTMIGGYAEVMRDIPNETTPENMQIIIDETSRLSTLVNELLDFSRMQTGSVEMQPADFDLTAAVETIVTRVGKLTAKDSYEIRFAPDQHIITHADETRIGQVVYNLIGNALTYTGADKLVTVEQRIAESRVRIAIHDTGKGIAPDELPLIWNRYYRTRETHKRAVVGSGLGLNIVRSILELHRAPYGVDSADGEGTTFWFELPVVKDSEY